MRRLRRLSLFSCGLSSLPEAVCELRELRTLELGHNRIQVLPQSLTQLVHLERIGIRGNPLRSVDVLASLPLLQHVEVDFSAEPEVLSSLQRLGARGVRVDVREASHHQGAASAIQIAVMRGDRAAVARLLTPESMTTLLGYPEYSLLDIACLRGDLALVRLLCEAGMSCQHSPGQRYRSTPLHQVCSFSVTFCQEPSEWGERARLIRYLVQQGADLEARDFAGLTPLHRACKMGLYSAWGRSDLVRALVKTGADFDATSPEGATGIELAVRLGDLRTAMTLVSLGADLRSAEPGLAHVAASHGHSRLCEALLDRGAPVRDSNGATPLHSVARGASGQRVDPRRRTEVIERVAARGVALDHRDALGRTALHEACAGRDATIVGQLIRLEAPLDLRDEAGSTPLHVAVRSAVVSTASSLRILTLLLEAGADPDVADGCGDTPLHLAARARHPSATRLLLRFAANACVRNEARETPEALITDMRLPLDRLPPLHCAACQGRVSRAVALVISGRAGVNKLDAEGRSPLFYAHRVHMARRLLRLGADPRILDRQGCSAEMVLREKKRFAAADAINVALGT